MIFQLTHSFISNSGLKEVKRGAVALSRLQRDHLMLGLNEQVTIKQFELTGEKKYIASLTLDVDFLSPNQKPTKLEHELFVKTLTERYSDRIYTLEEKFLMKIDKNIIVVRVEEISTSSLDFLMSEENKKDKIEKNEEFFGQSRGILCKQSVILFKSEKDSPLTVTGTPSLPGGKGHISILSPEWDFEKMGIGGLDNEFGTIFRRAFASRLFPAGEVAKYGIKHVRGLLLYGPPGKYFFFFIFLLFFFYFSFLFFLLFFIFYFFIFIFSFIYFFLK